MYSIRSCLSTAEDVTTATAWISTLMELRSGSWADVMTFKGPTKADVTYQARLFSAEEATGLRVHSGDSPEKIFAAARGLS